MIQYAKCRKSINRFLLNGRLGDIGHISCIDRRTSQTSGPDANAALDELAGVTTGYLADICQLLAHDPVSVMASYSQRDGMANLQAFLATDGAVDVHFFATSGDYCDEHELWLEGSQGSLRTDGNRVWWRKRGWPVFIPVRFGWFGGGRSTRAGDVPAGGLADAIIRSAERHTPCAIAGSVAGAS